MKGRTHRQGRVKGRESLHLITWHIPTRRYSDHGPIFFPNGQRPNYVNSIAAGKDGSVYALSRVSEDDRQDRSDPHRPGWSTQLGTPGSSVGVSAIECREL